MCQGRDCVLLTGAVAINRPIVEVNVRGVNLVNPTHFILAVLVQLWSLVSRGEPLTDKVKKGMQVGTSILHHLEEMHKMHHLLPLKSKPLPKTQELVSGMEWD